MHVKVRIASIAASAATVIAMAGDVVQMSPTALILIHDPSTIAMGNTKDMEKAITTLNEVKESIINAYAAKTGLSRSKISKLMSDETWMNAKKAVELGFADEILFDEKKPEPENEEESDEGKTDDSDEEGGEDSPDEEGKKPEKKPFKLDSDWSYSPRIMRQTMLGKITASCENPDESGSDGKSADTSKPAEKGLNFTPVIGMDGKTKDGAMPYEILKQQLAFLK